MVRWCFGGGEGKGRIVAEEACEVEGFFAEGFRGGGLGRGWKVRVEIEIEVMGTGSDGGWCASWVSCNAMWCGAVVT